MKFTSAVFIGLLAVAQSAFAAELEDRSFRILRNNRNNNVFKVKTTTVHDVSTTTATATVTVTVGANGQPIVVTQTAPPNGQQTNAVQDVPRPPPKNNNPPKDNNPPKNNNNNPPKNNNQPPPAKPTPAPAKTTTKEVVKTKTSKAVHTFTRGANPVTTVSAKESTFTSVWTTAAPVTTTQVATVTITEPVTVTTTINGRPQRTKVTRTKTKIDKVTKTKTDVVTKTAVVTSTAFETLVTTQTFERDTTVIATETVRETVKVTETESVQATATASSDSVDTNTIDTATISNSVDTNTIDTATVSGTTTADTATITDSSTVDTATLTDSASATITDAASTTDSGLEVKTTGSSDASVIDVSSTASGTDTAAPPANTEDPQTSKQLDPKSIMPNLANDGQNPPVTGQKPSLTSVNNFINFCLTQNVPLTDGKQIRTGSCNPAPMGRIIQKDKTPSAKFVFPKNFSKLQADQAFTIQLKVKNLKLGFFTNAQLNYYAAPGQVDTDGTAIGHTHVVIEPMPAIDSTEPLDPVTFAFFKGVNIPPNNDGVVTADVSKGLKKGIYRLFSINTFPNHQPVLASVAQHGSMDDAVYFFVE